VASQARAFRIHQAANDEGPTPVLHRKTPSPVRSEGDNLTARQLGIFLTVYLDGRQHTVRGLASLFGICKPAVTRSLDRLGELGLARRKVDPRDRRSVLVHRTELGWAFLADLRRAAGRAADDTEWAAASRAAARQPWLEAVSLRQLGHGPAANSPSD